MSTFAASVRRTARHGTTTRAREAPDPTAEPWGRGAVAVTGALLGLSLVGLVAGWAGISGTADLPAQARWLGFGIGALLLGLFAMATWVVLGLRAVLLARRDVLRALRAARLGAPPTGHAVAPHSTADRFGIASGMRRFHREGCDLLAGKDIRWLDTESLAFAATLPCGMCRPDVGSAPSASLRANQ